MKGAVGQIIHHESKNVLAVEQNKVLIPPQYNKYLSWGFSDLSVRIGHYESEKVSGCTIYLLNTFIATNIYFLLITLLTNLITLVFA